MILARTGQDAQALSLILATAGIGGVLGGLVMSSWGGPKRKVHGVLGGMTLTSLFGIFLMGLGRTVPVWMMAAFFSMFFVPIINGSNQAIWQAKVAPELQGRVFAVRRMIAQSSYLIGFLAAGPLADRFFEPAMQPGSALTEILGGWFGAGPGVGMALLMVLWGLIGASLSLGGYLSPLIRNVETLVADHDLVSNLKKVESSFERL